MSFLKTLPVLLTIRHFSTNLNTYTSLPQTYFFKLTYIKNVNSINWKLFSRKRFSLSIPVYLYPCIYCQSLQNHAHPKMTRLTPHMMTFNVSKNSLAKFQFHIQRRSIRINPKKYEEVSVKNPKNKKEVFLIFDIYQLRKKNHAPFSLAPTNRATCNKYVCCISISR